MTFIRAGKHPTTGEWLYRPESKVDKAIFEHVMGGLEKATEDAINEKTTVFWSHGVAFIAWTKVEGK